MEHTMLAEEVLAPTPATEDLDILNTTGGPSFEDEDEMEAGEGEEMDEETEEADELEEEIEETEEQEGE